MSESDFHICSESSHSNFDDRHVDFGEDFLEGGYGKLYSVSSLVSWQHFPRSTSSRCDDSFLPSSPSISGTPSEEVAEEESKPTEPPPSVPFVWQSKSRLKASHYLEIRHVFKFLNFLIGHLICNEPEDPIDFLDELLAKCLRFRDSFGEPPCLFSHSHVSVLYRAFDPFSRGYITMNQYKEGMRTLGLTRNITPYNEQPHLNSEGYVEESEFVFEATRCLAENLKQMLRIPKIWEDNPQIWKKRMEKKQAQMAKKKEIEYIEKFDTVEEKTDGRVSNKKPCINPCEHAGKVKLEPQQLFLDRAAKK